MVESVHLAYTDFDQTLHFTLFRSSKVSLVVITFGQNQLSIYFKVGFNTPVILNFSSLREMSAFIIVLNFYPHCFWSWLGEFS